MKKGISTIVCTIIIAVLLFSLCSCAAEKKLCGTWYNDFNGTRNAVQFYKNTDGEYIFIWAVYDLDSETVTSNTAGYYSVGGNSLTMRSSDSSDEMTFSYVLNGDTLILSGDMSELRLSRYTAAEG